MHRYNRKTNRNAFSTNSKYKQTTTRTISLTYSPRNQHNSRKKINIKTHKYTKTFEYSSTSTNIYKISNWPRNHSSDHIVESSSDATWTGRDPCTVSYAQGVTPSASRGPWRSLVADAAGRYCRTGSDKWWMSGSHYLSNGGNDLRLAEKRCLLYFVCFVLFCDILRW